MAMAQSFSSLVVLAGPNGAGKTTAARTLLADSLQLLTFVNADVIAQGLAAFDPDSAALEAGRIMQQRLHALAEERANFAFETTLAGRYLAGWFKKLRLSGYNLHLVYFWLESADLAVARVKERVAKGGHSVPEETIRRRYHRSVQNFFQLYRPLVTSWQFFDNSQTGFSRLIAQGEAWDKETILVATIWQQIKQKVQP